MFSPTCETKTTEKLASSEVSGQSCNCIFTCFTRAIKHHLCWTGAGGEISSAAQTEQEQGWALESRGSSLLQCHQHRGAEIQALPSLFRVWGSDINREMQLHRLWDSGYQKFCWGKAQGRESPEEESLRCGSCIHSWPKFHSMPGSSSFLTDGAVTEHWHPPWSNWACNINSTNEKTRNPHQSTDSCFYNIWL